MKKATKLLTAVATAAALILGASAFVSCSSGSDDDTPAETQADTPADTRSKEEKAYGAKVAEAQDFVKNNPKFAIPEDVTDKKLTDEATAYNTAFDDLEKLLTEDALKKTADDVEEAREDINFCEKVVAAGKAEKEVEAAIKAIEKLSEGEYKVDGDTKLADIMIIDEAKKIDESIDDDTKLSDIKDKKIFDQILDEFLKEVKTEPDGIFAEATENIEKALNKAKTALEKVEGDGTITNE